MKSKMSENGIKAAPPSSLSPARPHARSAYVSSHSIEDEFLKNVMENYLEYYAVGQGHTARAKRYDLQHFLLHLAGSPSQVDTIRVSDWTYQKTQDFVDSRLGLGEAPASVGRRLATLKHFGRTLAERVHGYINPAREVKSPVLKAPRPHGLSAVEIKLLRQAAENERQNENDSFLAQRNQFLLELLLATGLRADEVRLLLMSQIADDFQWLKNVKTKGRKFRNVYLDSEIRERFIAYAKCREEALFEKYPPLREKSVSELTKLPVLVSFYGVTFERPASFGLSPKSIWRIISNFGKKAQALSTEKIGGLHPHRLRHTFAHGLLDSSKDVRLVAQALGHSDVRTTMRYTERSEEEIAKAIETRIARSR